MQKFVNERIHDICNQKDKYWKHLTNVGGEVKNWKSNYNKKEKELIGNYDNYAAQLTKWLDTKEYMEVHLDYESGGEDLKLKGEEEYKNVIERLNESNPGRVYFTKIYKDKNSWINSNLFASGRKVHSSFWEIVGELATTIVNVEKKNAPVVLKEIVYRRSSIYLYDWNQQIWDRPVIKETKTRTVTVTQINVKKTGNWAKNLEDSGIDNSLKGTIEIFNLAFCVKSLADSKTSSDKIKNTIGFGGAIVDMIDALAKRFPLYHVKCMDPLFLKQIDHGLLGIDIVQKGFFKADYLFGVKFFCHSESH